MRKETMSLYLPSSSLLLARPADLQYGRLHGDRCLPDCLPQDWSQSNKLEVPLRRKRSKLQARLRPVISLEGKRSLDQTPHFTGREHLGCLYSSEVSSSKTSNAHQSL